MMATVRNERQRGAVLMVTLIFLIVIAIMGLTSMQSSKLELKMAGNEVVREGAHQSAQALIDTIIADPSTTPVIGGIGFTLCTVGVPNCNMNSLIPAAGPVVDQIAAGSLSAQAVLTSTGPPPPGTGYSADIFIANHYRLTSAYDRADEGLGRATLTQGIVVLTTTGN
jgi:hypothetical protein